MSSNLLGSKSPLSSPIWQILDYICYFHFQNASMIASTALTAIRHSVPSKTVFLLGFTDCRHIIISSFFVLFFLEARVAHLQIHSNFVFVIFSIFIGRPHNLGGMLFLEGMQCISSRNVWTTTGLSISGLKEWKIKKNPNFGWRFGYSDDIVTQDLIWLTEMKKRSLIGIKFGVRVFGHL